MKLKEIHRTSTFAWSPESTPLLATGTVAGALDESFSNASALEIWAPDLLDRNEYELGGEGQTGPKASVPVGARFNRIAWGYVHDSRPRGIIATGLENGELNVFDAAKLFEEDVDTNEAYILKNSTHTGPVRGLDFNPIQTNLFSSGATNGEIYIWNLQDPSKPYSPGTRSAKLDEITSLAWNQQVPHVLATASSTGYTVVWDLRGKREVVALAYGGGSTGGPAGGMGGRRGMSDLAWHPDNATRLVTCSEDDSSPVVMMWDLRNARAPEKLLTGHEKGVLSLSWCKQDADLLLSCGKDNRALCWNPSTAAVVGELPAADNWAFQVEWCPRNPDLFALAGFDGTIAIHNAQSTGEAQDEPAAPPSAASQADGADIFDNPVFTRTNQATLALRQPPKWLRRPTSATFGFGGQLVTVSNLPSAQGKTQSAVVHLRTVTTEPTIVERAKDLQKALSTETLSLFAQQRSAAAGDEADTGAGWKALLSLFQSNSRDELVTLLGFSKAEVAARVAEAVASLKATARAKSPIEQDVADSKPFEPSVVSFAEPPADEATPSEVSATTDATGPTEQGDGESTTTAPSLFGDEQPATPQTDATADFFSSMGLARNAGADQMEVPHTDYPADSSVAATIASRPSSAMSELKATTFRIYPRDESETDRLVTKALVLGDFESAVSLCLSTDRFADALLLAVKGGPELLQRTQKEYFERRTASHPYLRLFQSVVTDDLADIVQNADLQEWQEIFVVLCTFASQEEFAGLTEQLGQRLEFASSLARASDGPDTETLRKNATLTYLAAGKLERLVNIWIEELAEEEKRVLEDPESADESRYNAHAHALQTLIEKVIVFRSAIKYDDADLALAAAPGATRTYKLGALYERYFEYADLLATQGLVKEAVAFIKLTPGDYAGSPGTQIDFATGRDRLLAAAGVSAAVAAAAPVAPARVPPQPVYGGYNVPPPAQPAYPQQSNGSGLGYSTGHALPPTPYTLGGGAPPAPPSGLYTPASVPTQAPPPGPYTPSAPIASAAPPAPGPYGYSAGQYGVMGSGPNHIPGSGPYRPPQPAFQPAQPAQPPVPPPKRGPVPGWNDAPVIPERRAGAGSASKPGTPAPIMSPFLNAGPPSLAGPGSPQVASGGLPPPPRSGSAAGFQGPPPRGGMGLPPPSRPPTNPPPPGGRLPPGPPPPAGTPGGAPPMRGHMAPPQGGFAPPAQAGPYAQQQPMGQPGMQAPPPPSGPYAPPPGAQGAPPPSNPYGAPANAQPGPYGPPPGAQPGPYGPPAGAQGGMPPPPGGGPPPPGAGGPPPPPGGPASGPPRSSSLRTKPGPPPPKYPAGDRSHIPESSKPIFEILSGQVEQMRQTTPPQQKRIVDDIERRVNVLFDALNCETLSAPVVEQTSALAQAMAAHDKNAAAQLHMQLLTTGSLTDDIGMWMMGVKQLIMRL